MRPVTYVTLVIIALALLDPAVVAAADDPAGAPVAAAKKRVLIINIPPTDAFPKAETEIVDGVLCSEATKLPGYTVICAGNVDVLNKHKDFAQQFGGSGCAKGQCMEGLVERYQPDLIVRTTAKKSGSDLELTLNLLDSKGASMLGTSTKTISTKDAAFMAKLGELVAKVLASPKPPPPPPAAPGK